MLSFSQALYTAAESEGQVEVCVDSLVPVARDAVATIITVSQSAIGMCTYTSALIPYCGKLLREKTFADP